MKKILIADDDERIRKLLRLALTGDGYEVAEAEDGMVALRELGRNQYDLVITDIVMPDKEGIEFIMELRRDYPEVPFIAISGGGHFARGEFLDVASKLGAAATFAKPFELKPLLDAVRAAAG